VNGVLAFAEPALDGNCHQQHSQFWDWNGSRPPQLDHGFSSLHGQQSLPQFFTTLGLVSSTITHYSVNRIQH